MSKIVPIPKPDLTTKTTNPQGNTVVDHWKAKLNFSAHRKFTFRERVAIFLGYELDIEVIVFCTGMPGKIAPQVGAGVTPLTDRRDYVAAARWRFWNAPTMGAVPKASEHQQKEK